LRFDDELRVDDKSRIDNQLRDEQENRDRMSRTAGGIKVQEDDHVIEN
jgi:hypothetical protein